jgi:hypothetical protein
MFKIGHVFQDLKSSNLQSENPNSSSASTRNERDVSVRPPWFDGVSRLVSWWDVERFAAERFYMVGLLLERRSAILEQRLKDGPDAALAWTESERIAADIEIVRRECVALSLEHSADAADEFRQRLDWGKYPLKVSELANLYDELSSSIRREMKRTLFLHIPKKQADMYEDPLKEWDPTPTRFPETILMLVAEFGAIQVGTLVGLNDPKPGWQSVSRELKRIVQPVAKLNPAEQKHFKLLEQLLPLMLAMEHAWRNKVDHAANQLVLLSGEFQSYVADEIISATRAFMRRLATDLPAT